MESEEIGAMKLTEAETSGWFWPAGHLAKPPPPSHWKTHPLQTNFIFLFFQRPLFFFTSFFLFTIPWVEQPFGKLTRARPFQQFKTFVLGTSMYIYILLQSTRTNEEKIFYIYYYFGLLKFQALLTFFKAPVNCK